jgi:two-component system KDP operon response regulator KdpE
MDDQEPNTEAPMQSDQAEQTSQAQNAGEDIDDALGVDLDTLHGEKVRTRVLIIDDDPDTVQLLKMTLRAAGMDVTGALDADEALEKCIRHPPDILLLDLMMPEVDGWETLQRLRKVTDAPVVIVSAKETREEVVDGLDTGADDYITKPFYPPEVVSRLKAVLRRAGPSRPVMVLNFPRTELNLNLSTNQVKLHDRSIVLTSKEFELLSILARNAPKPVRYEDIAMEVWGEYGPKIRKRIKWIVHNLRQKMVMQPSDDEIIQNRPGFGYRLKTIDKT